MNVTSPRPCSPASSRQPWAHTNAHAAEDAVFHLAPLMETSTISPAYWRPYSVPHSYGHGDTKAGIPPTDEEANYDLLDTMPPDTRITPSFSRLGYVSPSPRSSMEAYLLLEAARSERVISRMREDLAHEIVHRNVIALQLNRLVLENARNDTHAADELVGHVRFSIRRSGHSVAHEQAMQEPHSSRYGATKGIFEPNPSAFDVALD